MTSKLLLDTNTLGVLVRARSHQADARLRSHDPESIFISAVTEGEILFGIAKSSEATRIAAGMRAVLAKFAILPWTSQTATAYGTLRAELNRRGISLGALDMMIAAQAYEIGAILVTSDMAFRNIPQLRVEDWLQA
ncbi:type II toxin-antitoxin system VapC family toxin [Mesorhizobium sp. IMUNJ 23232]|uniref:type II toxin-antitoxin system VapC family toxin n=1 Tax=Mesorhizobium sp. IMUNJ 23232 TaxID=3376064 RepID=UPI00379361D1